MTKGRRSRYRKPSFIRELKDYIRVGEYRAIRKLLDQIEIAHPDVRCIAVDVPSDTIVFGSDYVEEQEMRLGEEERSQKGGLEGVSH